MSACFTGMLLFVFVNFPGTNSHISGFGRYSEPCMAAGQNAFSQRRFLDTGVK